MVDLTKKLNISQLNRKSLASGDLALVYNSDSAIGNRAALVDLNAAIQQASQSGSNRIFVSGLSDLPQPIGGVITLADGVTYDFTQEVDLLGDRLVGGRNTTILGASSESAKILSTGLIGTALITSNYTMPIRHITLEADIIFDLDANGNPFQALDWYGVNLVSDNIGRIADYSNFVASSMAFLGASGLVFDGTFGTVAFSASLFIGSTGTTIAIPATATISTRFRIIYSSVVTGSGLTGIDVSSSASIPVEGYILDTVNFSGAGTATSGVQYNDNKARFLECRGVINSASITGYYMNGNATATTIVATGTPVKVAGTTTTMSISQRFTNTDNRATYSGEIARDFKILVSLTLTSGNNNQIGVYIAKNGVVLNDSEMYVTANTAGRVENAVCQALTMLSNGDYIEVFVENNSAIIDVTVSDLSCITEALN